MIEIRPFADLGRFDNDLLSARYHFSFANYHDPARRGFGPLLVWNDDTIQPGRGFDRHGHRDMEIITYVREGAISHEDHLGNRGRTEAAVGQAELSCRAGEALRLDHAGEDGHGVELFHFSLSIGPEDSTIVSRQKQ